MDKICSATKGCETRAKNTKAERVNDDVTTKNIELRTVIKDTQRERNQTHQDDCVRTAHGDVGGVRTADGDVGDFDGDFAFDGVASSQAIVLDHGKTRSYWSLPRSGRAGERRLIVDARTCASGPISWQDQRGDPMLYDGSLQRRKEKNSVPSSGSDREIVRREVDGKALGSHHDLASQASIDERQFTRSTNAVSVRPTSLHFPETVSSSSSSAQLSRKPCAKSTTRASEFTSSDCDEISLDEHRSRREVRESSTRNCGETLQDFDGVEKLPPRQLSRYGGGRTSTAAAVHRKDGKVCPRDHFGAADMSSCMIDTRTPNDRGSRLPADGLSACARSSSFRELATLAGERSRIRSAMYDGGGGDFNSASSKRCSVVRSSSLRSIPIRCVDGSTSLSGGDLGLSVYRVTDFSGGERTGGSGRSVGKYPAEVLSERYRQLLNGDFNAGQRVGSSIMSSPQKHLPADCRNSYEQLKQDFVIYL